MGPIDRMFWTIVLTCVFVGWFIGGAMDVLSKDIRSQFKELEGEIKKAR
jgi:hypothetical protein